MKKFYVNLIGAAALMLAINTTAAQAEEILAGKAFEDRLMHSELVLRPVGQKKREGAVTRVRIKLLPTGEATWTTNGKYPRETLLHWDVKGNMLCLTSPREQFWDLKKRREVNKYRKKLGTYWNCGVLATKGNRVTLYAPQNRSYGVRAYTGTIRSIWP